MVDRCKASKITSGTPALGFGHPSDAPGSEGKGLKIKAPPSYQIIARTYLILNMVSRPRIAIFHSLHLGGGRAPVPEVMTDKSARSGRRHTTSPDGADSERHVTEALQLGHKCFQDE